MAAPSSLFAEVILLVMTSFLYFYFFFNDRSQETQVVAMTSAGKLSNQGLQ